MGRFQDEYPIGTRVEYIGKVEKLRGMTGVIHHFDMDGYPTIMTDREYPNLDRGWANSAPNYRGYRAYQGSIWDKFRVISRVGISSSTMFDAISRLEVEEE